MNTLKCKALLIKTSLLVFARATGIYLLITVPALAAEPYIYLVSAQYALSFGWMAAVIFLLLFYAIQKIKATLPVKNFMLYGSVVIAVVIAFQMMETTGMMHHIWQSGAFLLFPGAAIISGWISAAVSRQKIKCLFDRGHNNYLATTIHNNS